MTTGVLFPGQGSQFCGMGRDWAEAHEAARRTFEQADALLDFPLSAALWAADGDVERTDIAQPGIFVTSVAVTRVLVERGLEREQAGLTAGLSLGEYSALWFAKALRFEDALRLVRLRGQAMQAASEKTPSSMISLTGASLDQAESLAALGSASGICAVANLNAPGQIILSGEIAALEAAEAAAREHGVRRTRRLAVAGGFHSECMRPAADKLAAALEHVELCAPTVPFLSNVSGGLVSEPEELRNNLAEQVCAPVRWEASMRAALELGVHQVLEPAPGKVLAGLMGRIDPDARVRSAAVPADLEPA